ncbi:MAG TPA: FAD-dependent oxidoreductase [Flavobacteriaceae bacterium]|nr:FAD-dependent oxidoreductase [Flavobacteriaceae bacterium]
MKTTTKSVWQSFSNKTHFPELTGSLKVEVAIIGGGITGISLAQLLSEKGIDVAVLEARKIGSGSTSDSTGNLYSTIDQTLSSLSSSYGTEDLQRVVLSRKEVINSIESTISRFQIDCDFHRRPMYLFSGKYDPDGTNREIVEKEFRMAVKLGMATERPSPSELPIDFGSALKYREQAQFNPFRYVQGLAHAISKKHCKIFENTRVTKIEENDSNSSILETENGGFVKANYLVQATHTPKGVRLMYHTVLGPYREYGIAAKLKTGTYPKGIFWGFFDKGEKFSIRTYERGAEKFLIAVGQPHKVGQDEHTEKSVQKLISFLNEHFVIREITHRWGGQNYRPADKLPYIGRKSENSNIFLATGFSTDGLVYGSLAAKLISDEIAGIKNPFADFYKASRLTPIKSAKNFVKENANVAVQYLKNLPLVGNEPEFEEINIGNGKIVSKDQHKIAAYREETGNLKLFSAICPHLKCVVQWNAAEKTWDCPCHGSRFDLDGEIIEGPALHPLSKIVLEDEEANSIERK